MYGRPSNKLARTLLAAGAILAGCSESPNPAAPASEPLKPNFVLGGITDEPQTAAFGTILVCKTGNVPSGTFTIAMTSGTGTFSASATVAVGTCVEVARDFIVSETGSVFTVDETSAGELTATVEHNNAGVFGSEAYAGEGLFVNSQHGHTITFDNFVGCTYTKGWYRNKNGSPTVIAVDDRSIADAQAIFNATPGKPGSVTWQGGNNVLNLYQQFLAALNNLGGDTEAGPDDVDAAIDAVQLGTGGDGTNITSTLTQAQVSSLINVLSAFNEGTFAGWPHCDDEVLNGQ